MKKSLFAALGALSILPALAVSVSACDGCMEGEMPAPTVAKTAVKAPVLSVKTVTFSAPKMHCGGCAMGIKTTLKKQNGVKTVEANPETKLVVVSYLSAKQNPKMLVAALAKAGWIASEVKAGAKPTAPAGTKA